MTCKALYIKDVPKTEKWKRRCQYKCFCGNLFEARYSAVKYGTIKSCGCLKHTHNEGWNITSEYGRWGAMKARCYNSNTKQFKDYGGRGIRVCSRWLHSYENFLKDMGRCPKGYSLDRIDNDGNYSPNNCRWATRHQQQANRRICVSN